MPLLQVRDFPENYYHKLNELSERENRSITQQTIYMLKTMLDSYDLNLNTKRKAALSSIHNLSLKISSDAPSATDLIREDRDSDHTNLLENK